MVSFEIPQWAMLQVTLPTGGETAMLHIGGGRFLSRIPPIALTGMKPDFPLQQEGVPVSWDGTTMPGDSQNAHPAVFGFDAVGATRALQDAAAAGDTFAKFILSEFEAAEKTLAAREALGVMTPAAATAVETKSYGDGTEATGVAPLPEASPATAGQCNDERSCGACFADQGGCENRPSDELPVSDRAGD